MNAPGRFRERTPQFRARAAQAAPLSPILESDFVRTHGVGLILALFVAVSGAFGTGHITPNVRYPIIAALTLLVIVIDFGIRAVLERWVRSEVALLRATLRVSLLLASAIIVCWGAARLFEGAQGTPPLPRFVLPVLAFAAVAAALGRAIGSSRSPAKVLAPARPAFVGRLPGALQNAEIIAVEGEDHYVCVHTSRGRHLLHMRFGDALSELKMLDGLQSHRSWWVAKSAVSAVKRGNGRATLKLANGLEAPVSRRYAQCLRKKGWY